MKIVEVDDVNGVNASQFMVDIKEEKIDGGYQQATSGGTFRQINFIEENHTSSDQIFSPQKINPFRLTYWG